MLERFGIIPNNYIVFMGRLVQDKNPDYLIKGFMNSQHGDKQLVICGCAAPRSSYGDYLHMLAKDDQILFLQERYLVQTKIRYSVTHGYFVYLLQWKVYQFLY